MFRLDWTAWGERQEGGGRAGGEACLVGFWSCTTSFLFAKYACFPWFLSCEKVSLCCFVRSAPTRRPPLRAARARAREREREMLCILGDKVPNVFPKFCCAFSRVPVHLCLTGCLIDCLQVRSGTGRITFRRRTARSWTRASLRV